jgi:hypothetical protein
MRQSQVTQHPVVYGVPGNSANWVACSSEHRSAMRLHAVSLHTKCCTFVLSKCSFSLYKWDSCEGNTAAVSRALSRKYDWMSEVSLLLKMLYPTDV